MNKVHVVGSKPQLGVPLEKYQVFLRYRGQVKIVILEGDLFDITSLMTNPDLQSDFKEEILEQLSFLETLHSDKPVIDVTPIPNASTGSTALAESAIQEKEACLVELIREGFKSNYALNRICRVLLLEESFNERHMIFQFGRLNTVTDYTCYPEKSHWKLTRSEKVERLLFGVGVSFPHKVRLVDLGELYLHAIFPDDYRCESDISQEFMDAAKVHMRVMPYIPQLRDNKAILKAKDDIIKSKDDTIKAIKEQLTEKSVRLDAHHIAVAGHETKNPLTEAVSRKFDITDSLLILGPILLFAAIGNAFSPLGWVVGTVLGGLSGCAAVAKRR